jgi:hypothetical protein
MAHDVRDACPTTSFPPSVTPAVVCLLSAVNNDGVRRAATIDGARLSWPAERRAALLDDRL